MLDVGLYFCYTLLIVAAVSAIVLPLIKAAAEPRTLVRSLIGVAALLVIFGIAFALSDSSVKPTWLVQGIGETSFQSHRSRADYVLYGSGIGLCRADIFRDQ